MEFEIELEFALECEFEFAFEFESEVEFESALESEFEFKLVLEVEFEFEIGIELEFERHPGETPKRTTNSNKPKNKRAVGDNPRKCRFATIRVHCPSPLKIPPLIP